MHARAGRLTAAVLFVVASAIATWVPPSAAADPVGWGTAVPIDTDPISADEVSVAVSPDGTAFAVYDQWDGTRPSIWSNRYVPGQGWGTPTVIEGAAGWAEGEAIGVDAAGNAIAVWHQTDGTRFNIWSNRYVAGAGWGTPAIVETDNAGGASTPRVAVEPTGNATAVWSQSDGTRSNIWANRYIAGSGWLMATLIETDNVGDALSPRIAGSPAGDAFAVWQQSNGAGNDIWSNRFVAGSGWGMATRLEADLGSALFPDIGMDALGNGIAVWAQDEGPRFNIWSNRFAVGAGWTGPALLEADNAGGAQRARVAVAPAGEAVAVWEQSDGTQINGYANRYGVGTGWGTAVLLEANDRGVAFAPVVAMDPRGNAIAVWAQDDGMRFNIWSNRLSVTRGWEGAQLLETDNAGNAWAPHVAMDPSGNAFAVWFQGGFMGDPARNRIWANRYQADVVPPALEITAPTASLTAAASVTLAGTTEPGANVTVDGTPVTVGPTGSFTAVVPLNEGPNTIVVTATDPEGNVATATRDVVRDSTAPAVAITSPLPGTTTTRPTISVAGTTEPGASLVVNGLVVAVDAVGAFVVVVALVDGANPITASATDAAGNVGTDAVTVTLIDPLPGVQQDLQDAQAQLLATQNELSETRAALNATNQELQDTRATLDATNARLASLGVEVIVGLVIVVAVLAALQFAMLRKLRGSVGGPPRSATPPP